MTGKVLAVCVSKKKGVQKTEIPEAKLVVEHGIEGDAHAGPWHRQVSLLDWKDVETVRAKGLDLGHGAFAENFVLAGIDLVELGLGTRLRIGGQAEVSFTQIAGTYLKYV